MPQKPNSTSLQGYFFFLPKSKYDRSAIKTFTGVAFINICLLTHKVVCMFAMPLKTCRKAVLSNQKSIVMKRVMIMIAAAALLLSTSSFALDVKGYVTAKALSAFAKDFSGATNVNWQEKENFYLVEFRVGETNCTAAYSEEGELIASTKVIKLKELLPAVTQLVKENYPGYEVGENVVALTCSGKVITVSQFLTVKKYATLSWTTINS
jgi:hypothetical protein